ncbi:hypothetical protein GCM10009648_02330 [Tsukamurella spumae]
MRAPPLPAFDGLAVELVDVVRVVHPDRTGGVGFATPAGAAGVFAVRNGDRLPPAGVVAGAGLIRLIESPQ